MPVTSFSNYTKLRISQETVDLLCLDIVSLVFLDFPALNVRYSG